MDQYTTWGVVAAAVIAALVVMSWLRRAMDGWRWRATSMFRERKAAGKSYDELSREYHALRNKLEQRNGGVRVVDFVHDIGAWPQGRDNAPARIDWDEAFHCLRRIRETDHRPIDIVLHTGGGFALPTELIAAAVRSHPGQTRAFVPYIAMSGGTIVALAAEKIVMGKAAALGPIDSQFGLFSVSSLVKLKDTKSADRISDEYLLLAYEAEKVNKTAVERATALINPSHIPANGRKGMGWLWGERRDHEEKASALARDLASGSLFHSQRISYDKAKEMKMNVSADCPSDMFKLVDLRLQMIRRKVEDDHAREAAEKADKAKQRPMKETAELLDEGGAADLHDLSPRDWLARHHPA